MRKIRAFEKKGRGSEGFTLIEMLIVIAVIAILAGIVLTGVSGFQAAARDTRRIGDLRNATNFMELYFNKCGHYPGGIGAGPAFDCITTDPADWSDLQDAMTDAGITSSLPGDPGPGAGEYEYASDVANLQYVMKAVFERDNNALDTDVNGTVHGLACTDTATNFFYCVTN